MKVLLVLEVAAASRYWTATIEALLEANVDPTVVTLSGAGELQSDLSSLDCRTLALGFDSRLGSLRAIPALRRLIGEESFDVVHAHEVMPMIVAGRRPRSSRFAIRVFHRHHACTTGRHALASKVATRLADYTVAVSSAAATCAMRADGAPADKVRTVLNGVPPLRDVSAAETLGKKRELGIPEDAHVVLLLARMRREKGHATALEALAGLGSVDAQPIVTLVVGDGPLREQVRAQISELGLDAVVTGHVDDVALYFALADVVVVPSYQESFGLVAAEAMAAARPVVASDIEGLAEVVDHGHTGLLVPARDVGAFGGAVRELLGDPDSARTLGEAGYERYQRLFTTQRMVAGWLACYEEFAGGTGR